jgi:hypothetical protein
MVSTWKRTPSTSTQQSFPDSIHWSIESAPRKQNRPAANKQSAFMTRKCCGTVYQSGRVHQPFTRGAGQGKRVRILQCLVNQQQ